MGLTNYSDRCLNILFTNHDFGGTLGREASFKLDKTLLPGIAYTGTVCEKYKLTTLANGSMAMYSQNIGYITFRNNSLLGTTFTTFAHEVHTMKH